MGINTYLVQGKVLVRSKRKIISCEPVNTPGSYYTILYCMIYRLKEICFAGSPGYLFNLLFYRQKDLV